MKGSLVQQCLDILKREDIKQELNLLSKTIISYVFYETKPFVLIFIMFMSILFVMNLVILVILILLLNKSKS